MFLFFFHITLCIFVKYSFLSWFSKPFLAFRNFFKSFSQVYRTMTVRLLSIPIHQMAPLTNKL